MSVDKYKPAYRPATRHYVPIDDREWNAMTKQQQARANLAQYVEGHQICTEPEACLCKCGVCKKARNVLES